MQLQLVVPRDLDGALFSALSGLLATAHLEHDAFDYQIVSVDRSMSTALLVAMLAAESSQRGDRYVRYADGTRLVRRWSAGRDAAAGVPWKPGGVYLITGGAGGLGLIVAADIARQTPHSTVWLTGRAPLSGERAKRVAALNLSGRRVEYRQVDVANAEAMAALVADIRTTSGRLNGVIHAAGVLHDRLLLAKTADEMRAVLAPKVGGVVALDRATADLPLDFFVLFSSVVGPLGNIGQSDYATANAFLDAYASYRDELVAAGERHGRTVAIDWPAWADGGMRAATRTQRAGETPAASLSTGAGLRALYRVLAASEPQIAVITGTVEEWSGRLDGRDVAGRAAVVPETSVPAADLADRLEAPILRVVSALLRVHETDLDLDVPLGDFGFDSISLTTLANTLNGDYGLELAPTIFFEHSTLRRIIAYLAQAYGPRLAARLGVSASAPLDAAATAAVPQALQPVVVEEPLEAEPPSIDSDPLTTSPAVVADSAAPIAIIGMAGRFPDAIDLDAFWVNLRDGVDSVREIPPDRWDWRAVYGDPAEANKTNVNSGAFLAAIDEFDAAFFGLARREAGLMDPRHRLLMMYVWAALEDAGYAPSSLSGSRTAIFVGTSAAHDQIAPSDGDSAERIDGYSVLRNIASTGPNRMSYLLNFHGPSEPVETACSSSLVAIHRAVLALRVEGCEMAIAGGVNTILTPRFHVSFSKAGMLSADGRCRPFSAHANGYGRGEGVGMLVLKPLHAAERDGDHVYAVIRGSAVNHGGRGSSPTAPNVGAQASVIKAALAQAHIDPRTVTYVEAHGTGTALGDPVEVDALRRAFGELLASNGAPGERAYCGVGSVKSNIGHLELAAGVAGVIKVVLQLQHGTLAKTLHCEDINPRINLDDTPFYIVRDTAAWPSTEPRERRPRRAGVSSFGIGGVNAHLVIEEHVPSRRATAPSWPPGLASLIVLAAKREADLTEQARQLLSALDRRAFSDADVPSIAYTLQVGRDAFEHRLAFQASSIASLRETLTRIVDGSTRPGEVYRGDSKNKDAVAILVADDDVQDAVVRWLERGKHERLISLWAKGLSIDWRPLYGAATPRRISLPTYPFARDKHPVANMRAASDAPREVAPRGRDRILHPLVHRNTSNLAGQRFTSRFDGRESFFANDAVRGVPTLPSVAHLEMVYVAILEALPMESPEPSSIALQLKDHRWGEPIVAGRTPATVHIGLTLGDLGEIAYTIYSTTDEQQDEIVHACGRAAVSVRPHRTSRVGLATLQARCTRTLDRGLANVRFGSDADGRWFALARLDARIGDGADASAGRLALLEGLESATRLAMADCPAPHRASPSARLLSFDEADITMPLPAQAWVHVRSAATCADGAVDVVACDDSGSVLLQVRGLVAAVPSLDCTTSGTEALTDAPTNVIPL